MDNSTTNFLNNLRTLYDNSGFKKHYYQARLCLLDYLSCLLGGKAYYRRNLGLDESDGCVQTNALRYGLYSHVLELDDGHRKGAVHVGSTVFSALLAEAERRQMSSDDFLLGVIVGYEATVRLACAVQPGNKLRGYHATGTCGTVGAALGIAAALHYTEEQTNTTLAAAVAGAAGVLEMQEDDSDLKPYNVGRAAMDAVAAAYIGRSGMKGPKDALGGKRGFLKVMTDEPHPEYLTDFTSKTLCIEQIYQKVYAACRHAHPAIEAAFALRDEIAIDEIEHITVQAYKLAVAGHDHKTVSSISSAKMSIPFSVAVALIKGDAGLQAFTEETVLNQRILDLAQKVDVVEDELLTAQSPAKRASIAVIQTSKGTFTKQVDYPKGEPENPLSKEELEEKFKGLAMYGGLTEEECDTIIDEIWKEDGSIEKIIRVIRE